MAKAQLRPARHAFYFEAQGGICALRRSFECRQAGGHMARNQRRSPRRPTWDHIKPKGEGGKDPHNILLACSQCNHERGSHFPAPYEAPARARELWDAWMVRRAELLAEARTRPKKSAASEKPAKRKLDLAALGWDMEDGMGRREIERHLLGR